MKICPKGNRSLKLDSFTLPSFLFLIEMHIPSIPQFFPGQRLGFRDKVYRSWPAILSLSSINENVKRLNELFNPPACIFLKRPSPDFFFTVADNRESIEQPRAEQSRLAPGYRARISVDDFTLQSSLDPTEDLGSTMLLRKWILIKSIRVYPGLDEPSNFPFHSGRACFISTKFRMEKLNDTFSLSDYYSGFYRRFLSIFLGTFIISS